MIERLFLVELFAKGCHTSTITVKESQMSFQMLRDILLKHHGEDRKTYCWFNSKEDFDKAIEEINEKIASAK